MATAPALPRLEFYERADCPVCDEARDTLQQVLEDRARRGVPVPRVAYVRIHGQPDLEARYGPLVPVLALGGREMSLTTSYQAIARFIDALMPQLA